MAAEWGTEDGKDHVEFPNSEYAQWWINEPNPSGEQYCVLRWSGALGLVETLEQTPMFVGDTSSIGDRVLHRRGSVSKIVSPDEFQAGIAEGDGDFFRLDSAEGTRALLWSGPDPDPPHDEPEYAECSAIFLVEDDATDLRKFIDATATPEVKAIAGQIVARAFREVLPFPIVDYTNKLLVADFTSIGKQYTYDLSRLSDASSQSTNAERPIWREEDVQAWEEICADSKARTDLAFAALTQYYGEHKDELHSNAVFDYAQSDTVLS